MTMKLTAFFNSKFYVKCSRIRSADKLHL